jgi:AcrR family transcriptional regulator
MRLVRAALELCVEQGYQSTTIAEIAERAGLTRATFFRYFPDKREVLFAGQEEHAALLTAGIQAAPPGATPLQAIATSLDALTATFTREQHAWGPALIATVAASEELQERDARKAAVLTAAMTSALVERGTPEPSARLAAELGSLALKRGFARWAHDERDDTATFAEHTRAALADLHVAATTLA